MKLHLLRLTIIGLFLSSSVSAHDESQPPFVFINNQATTHSTIRSTTLTDFFLPHDTLSSTYLVNTPISFVMQPEKLKYNPSTYLQTSYRWDFGDGSKSTKITTTHTYKRTGTYIVTIDAIHKNAPTQRIFSSFIHIVPRIEYTLPRPDIKTSSQDFSKPIGLDGTTPNVVYYYWDLGDGTTSDQPKVNHSYDTNHTNIHPILRVKDANGFITDTQTTITNTPQGQPKKLTLINRIFDPLRKLINKVFLQ